MGSLADGQSDLARLWNDALDAYSERAKVDIRKVMQSQMSINSIMMDQQQQLQNFGSFRHNKGKVDKLRSVIARNADVIQGVAQHVANAASGAFPPSSAVLTAFTYVMNASKHVSDDYDAIEGFFDVMNSFLERLSLLESKLPAQAAYQGFLIRVFSSLLSLSGLARAYCLKGRFTKWARALLEGKDPELQGALDGLNENLRRLESATIIQTLRTTIEAHDEARAAKEGVKLLSGQTRELQASVDHNTELTEKALVLTERTFTVTYETGSGVKDLLQHSKESANVSQEILRQQDMIRREFQRMRGAGGAGGGSQRPQRPGVGVAGKSGNLDQLRFFAQNPSDGDMRARLTEFELIHYGLFAWIEDEPAFVELVEGRGRSLWLAGGSGMGKSTAAYVLSRLLVDKLGDEQEVFVVPFFFEEKHIFSTGIKAVEHMIQWQTSQASSTIHGSDPPLLAIHTQTHQ